MDTCWERADLLAFLYVLFSCVFVTFPYGILDQVWYFIESISDTCLHPNLYYISYMHIIMLRKGILFIAHAIRSIITFSTVVASATSFLCILTFFMILASSNSILAADGSVNLQKIYSSYDVWEQ